MALMELVPMSVQLFLVSEIEHCLVWHVFVAVNDWPDLRLATIAGSFSICWPKAKQVRPQLMSLYHGRLIYQDVEGDALSSVLAWVSKLWTRSAFAPDLWVEVSIVTLLAQDSLVIRLTARWTLMLHRTLGRRIIPLLHFIAVLSASLDRARKRDSIYLDIGFASESRFVLFEVRKNWDFDRAVAFWNQFAVKFDKAIRLGIRWKLKCSVNQNSEVFVFMEIRKLVT